MTFRTAPAAPRPALRAMLEARSVAIVGASARPGSFGARMVAEVARSAARPAIHPVNPRYREIAGLPCVPSLADLPGPADLVLLGVPDAALEEQLGLAAALGCRAAVIFGNAHDPGGPGEPAPGPDGGAPGAGRNEPGAGGAAGPGAPGARRAGLRERLSRIARSAGMELCGAGCMGFANVAYGLRAMGYVEPDPLPAGPVALVTHSGSVFSALLRSRRAVGFTLAVSSGQELVTAAPAYLEYALDLPQTRVLALVLEALRDAAGMHRVLARAAGRGLPVVLLSAGGSPAGREMVAAHSGALAGSDDGWEALARAYGVHRVGDLQEMTDTLELFALRAGRGAPPPGRPGGIATVHDSGLERAHVTDLAHELGVRFADIGEATRARLAELLDPGLAPANPLDAWGTGAGTRELFAGCLRALAEDESVAAVVLAVDLVPELDGDDSYRLAVLDAARRTGKPVAVMSNLAGAIDRDAAALLRGGGVAVLEGTRSGLLALRHLLDHLRRQAAEQPGGASKADGSPGEAAGSPGEAAGSPGEADGRPDRSAGAGRAAGATADPGRRHRGRALLAQAGQTGAAQLALLREYGIPVTRAERATSPAAALAAAGRIGYPVVLKTDQPGLAHKTDAGGVVLGLRTPADLAAAYADVAVRLGPAVLVCETAPPGTELALGITRDPALGPLVVVGAGGTLVELLADRAVALPPLTEPQAAALLGELRVAALLAGARGAPPADLRAVVRAIVAVAELAADLGDEVEALDVNPLICGPRGAIAADALVIGRQRAGGAPRDGGGSAGPSGSGRRLPASASPTQNPAGAPTTIPAAPPETGT